MTETKGLSRFTRIFSQGGESECQNISDSYRKLGLRCLLKHSQNVQNQD